MTIDIKIPAVNLKTLVDDVDKSVNFFRALAADVPDNLKAQGRQAVDQYLDLILRGATDTEARRLLATSDYRYALDKRARYEEMLKNGGGPAAAALAMAIAKGEKAYWDAAQGVYVFEHNCTATSGPASPCQVLVQAGKLAAGYKAADVRAFFAQAMDTLAAVGPTDRFGAAAVDARLAMQCVLQWAIERQDTSILTDIRTQYGAATFERQLSRLGLDPVKFDLTERAVNAIKSGNVEELKRLRDTVGGYLNDPTNNTWTKSSNQGYGQLWAVLNLAAQGGTLTATDFQNWISGATSSPNLDKTAMYRGTAGDLVKITLSSGAAITAVIGVPYFGYHLYQDVATGNWYAAAIDGTFLLLSGTALPRDLTMLRNWISEGKVVSETGSVVRNALTDIEEAQALRLTKDLGGKFTGAPKASQQAHDGFYLTAQGESVAVDLKLLESANPMRILKETSDVIASGGKIGLKDITILVDAPNMTIARITEFALNGNLTKGMLNEGVVNQVIVRVGNEVVTISSGKVTPGYPVGWKK